MVVGCEAVVRQLFDTFFAEPDACNFFQQFILALLTVDQNQQGA
jgi:hypothetical protein